MYDMVHVIEGLSKEISNNLSELSKTRDLDEKKKLAEIVKMLCESLGVLFDGMDMLATDYLDPFDDDEDEEMLYDDGYSEDVVDFSSLKKGRKDKKKKKNRDDIPF
jgi:hypothetical protein